jgi:hypothetical protein
MLELPEPGVLYARVAVGFVLLLMYSYNIGKAYREWHRDRDWETYRQFLMAFELMFGVALIFSGYVNTAFFAQNEWATDVIRTFGYLLLGVLLVGGGTLVFSWRKPVK